MIRWFNYTTFDIIGDLAFGEPFGGLKSSKYDTWIQVMFNSIKSMAYLAAIGHFRIFPGLLTKLLIPRDLSTKIAENRQLAGMKVKKRLETGSNRPDYITSMTAKRNGEVCTQNIIAW